MLINQLQKIALKVTNKNITVSLAHAFCREQAASQMLKLPEGTETLLNHENTCTDKNHRTAPQTSKLLQPLQHIQNKNSSLQYDWHVGQAASQMLELLEGTQTEEYRHTNTARLADSEQ